MHMYDYHRHEPLRSLLATAIARRPLRERSENSVFIPRRMSSDNGLFHPTSLNFHDRFESPHAIFNSSYLRDDAEEEEEGESGRKDSEQRRS